MFAQSHALTTYEQTAIVYRPDTPLEFTTIAQRPVIPYDLIPALEAGKPVAIRRDSDDSMIQWWPDGLTKVIQAEDGVQLYFWPKPTMCEAMDYRHWRGKQGAGFFKFNNNGSVYGRCFGTNCYWGPNSDYGQPEIGERLESVEQPDGTWIFVNRGAHSSDNKSEDEETLCRSRECRY